MFVRRIALSSAPSSPLLLLLLLLLFILSMELSLSALGLSIAGATIMRDADECCSCSCSGMSGGGRWRRAAVLLCSTRHFFLPFSLHRRILFPPFSLLLSPHYRHTFRRRRRRLNQSKSQPNPTMNAAFREAAAQARQKPVLLTQNQEVNNIFDFDLLCGCVGSVCSPCRRSRLHDVPAAVEATSPAADGGSFGADSTSLLLVAHARSLLLDIFHSNPLNFPLYLPTLLARFIIHRSLPLLRRRCQHLGIIKYWI